jgi:enediyne polyketide synthase
MLSVTADRQAVERDFERREGCYSRSEFADADSPSGEALEISKVARRAEAHGLRTTLLRVSHAFHSPLVAPAGNHLYAHLSAKSSAAPAPDVFNVTGQHLNGDTDLRALLREQVTSPVRFMEAVNEAASSALIYGSKSAQVRLSAV